MFSESSTDKGNGVWIPGFLAVFSTDAPRLCWTGYDKVRKSQTPQQRVNPLQVNEIPERPQRLEQYTLKLAMANVYSLWKHTPEVGRGVPVVRVTLDDPQVRKKERKKERQVCLMKNRELNCPLFCFITVACGSSSTRFALWSQSADQKMTLICFW